MASNDVEAPESSAERVALWRALHVLHDPPPHILKDTVGLELLAPAANWRERPDMDPKATRGFRASIVARARLVEDLIADEVAQRGLGQLVLLGAGLDTFAQRRGSLASQLRIFEMDEPGPQAWKARRLVELGYGVPDWLRLVPVDFEDARGWIEQLTNAGFDLTRPSVVSCTGVVMYLSRAATQSLLVDLARLATGSVAAISFLLARELLEEADRAGLERSTRGARASGTPFLGLYRPSEMLHMASEAGFAQATHLPGSALATRYFGERRDGLQPSSGEDFLILRT